MDKQLKYLIDTLKDAGLRREATELTHLLIKSAIVVDQELDAWQKVLQELDRRPDIQIQTKAIIYLLEAAKNLKDAEPLKNAELSDIKESAQILKTVMANSNINPDNFFIKEANVFSALGKAAPLFSFIIAIKNAYYGFEEFKKIQSKASILDLNWMDTLQPSKMKNKARDLESDPKKLKILVSLTKSAMLLWDEGISLIVNLLDGFKDLLLIFPQIIAYIGTLGIGGIALTTIDFGISMFLWLAVENTAETIMNKKYTPILKFIRTKAQVSIAYLIEQQIPKIDDSEEIEINEDDFDVDSWWNTIS